MPKYRVRLCEPGDFIHDDSGESSVCAETADEAREFFEDYCGERPEFVHSHIGWPRVVYKRDVENGDAHEDAEPGDTTWDFLRDDGRDLKPDERRFWTCGPPSAPWRFEYGEPEPVSWRTVPVGAKVHHPVLGSGKVWAPLREWRASNTPLIPVEFRDGTRQNFTLSGVSILPGRDWPGDRRPITVTVGGEVVGQAVGNNAADALLAEASSKWVERWKATAP